MHKSVLTKEVVLYTNIKEGGILLDGTLGGGGHAQAIAEALHGNVHIIGLDRDSDALVRSRRRLDGSARSLDLIESNFRNLDTALDSLHVDAVDGIVLDLGWNAYQLESGRGFSFMVDEPLSMSYSIGKEGSFNAYTIVNEWNEEHIEAIIKGYGEEMHSRRIAEGIVKHRAEKPITSTFELRDIIVDSVPFWYRRRRIHPATKTFQALRIAVNDELDALREGLSKGISALKKRGRISVISFHSLEDRIVKRFFRDSESTGQGSVITKRPIRAGAEELTENPRSRSAKLRVFEKK